MRKKTGILMLFMMMSAALFASDLQVSQAVALRVAAKYFALLSKQNAGYRNLNPTIKFAKMTRDTLTYYVAGFSDRPGYVIISGTKLLPPVIGMSDRNAFDTNTMPPALKYFLRTKEDQVLRNLRHEGKGHRTSRFQKEWDFAESVMLDKTDTLVPSYYDSVGPLIHTFWGQDYPYNAHCPWWPPVRFPAGCGPVAMAQVLRYHQYPYSYNWHEMGTSITEYNEYVAGLVSDCGEAAGTSYGTLGSWTIPSDIDNAMWYEFGLTGSRYDKDFNYGQIRDQVMDGFPVIMQGREEWNMFDWHIFVVDGYWAVTNGSFGGFHINWGWDGSDDGWFNLNECNPPGDPGPYNYEQGIIHRMIPAGEVAVAHPLKGSAVPSSTPMSIAWTSSGRAGDLDSAMIIIYQENYDNARHGHGDLNYDTIRGLANKEGFNFVMHQFKNPAVLRADTGKAWIQVIVYGKYGDNAQYRYHSEQIPFGVYLGEYMTFTSPVAGTIWQANMHHTVAWNYNQNTSPEFRVMYKKVAGPSSSQESGQVVFTTQNNSVDWLIPATLEGTYQLKGYKLGSEPLLESYSEDFIISPMPTLNITSPVANGQFEPGNTMNIRWSSNTTEHMKIKLFRLYDFGNPDTIVIAASTPNDGVFDWVIPETLEPGTLYALSIEGVINPQIKDGVSCFTIQKKITITHPAAGGEWEMTMPDYVEWVSNFPENVDFKLYKGTTYTGNGGTNIQNDGSFVWTLPGGLTPGIDYRFRIYKTGDETVVDYSDFFSVVERRFINITAPVPNAGWQKGETYFIKWEENVPNAFKIELADYTYNPPQVTLINGYAFQGTSGYSWTIPSTTLPHSLYKIRVTSFQYPEVTALSEFFSITSGPGINVAFPTASANWPTATSHAIIWSDNLSGNVEISLYRRNISPGFVAIIAANIPSTGSYAWYIPQTLTPANDYYIIIRSKEFPTVQDNSSDFTITQGNYILVNTPSMGTKWQAGTSEKIKWADNIAANVMIILRKPSLGIEDTIAHSTASNGYYMWAIPANTVPATNYNILVRSVSDANVSDISDPFEVFSTSGSFITVTSPTADSVWKMGTPRTITWDDNIASPVQVSLYKGNASVLVLWASHSGNSLVFNVPTNLTAGTNYKVKVTSTTNSSVFDFSPYFTITPADFIDYTGPAVFRMNDSIAIAWNDNINEHVKIELLLADTLYSIITPSTESDGSYLWGVPGNLPVEYWYKIRITSLGNPALMDVSNASHIYFPLHIGLTSPLAGNIWLKKSSYAIQWTHNMINGEHYHVDLYKGGDSLMRIRYGNSSGYYLWAINALYNDLDPGNDYSIKVVCAERPEIYDFSEIFTILDCDSIPFSIGNDTVLLMDAELDIIATDGFDNYNWTPMQNSYRTNHWHGSYFTEPDTVQVIAEALYRGGCVKRDTMMLTVAEPPCSANAGFTISNIAGAGLCNSYTFCISGDSTSEHRYTWNFGDAIIMDTTSLSITHSYPGPGTFMVSCTAYHPVFENCQNIHTDTVIIEPQPSINVSKSVKVDTGFFVSTISGSGIYRVKWLIDSVPAVNIWKDSLFSDTLQVIFPENRTYQVCAEVYDTTNPSCVYNHCEEVIVSTIPPCRSTTCYFSYKPLNGYASGVRNKFQISGGVNEKLPCYQVTWNMGDGSAPITNVLDFVYEFSPGMHIVTMTVTNCGACSKTHTDTIIAYPPLELSLPSATSGCDSVQLSAAPGYPYYIWNDSTVHATLPVTSTGSYWVVAFDGVGYRRYDTSMVYISPSYHVALSPVSTLCSDGGAFVLSEGTPAGGVYMGNHIAGNTFDITNAGPGFHPVSYYFPNSFGCSDTAHRMIEVEPVFEGNQTLQNHYYTDTLYITGDTVSAGSQVTNTTPTGPCVFLDQSSTVIKAQLTVLLKPGTRIMNNSYFRAYTGVINCTGDNPVTAIDSFIPPSVKEETDVVFAGPNPAHDKTTIYKREGTLAGYNLCVLNGQGTPVIQRMSLREQEVVINVSFLVPGIYFIRVWGNGQNYTFKMIRE